MLLDRGMAKEALVALEATIKKEPNRFNALAGAAKASESLGNKAKAKGYYQNLVTLGNDADSARADLEAARKFLGEQLDNKRPEHDGHAARAYRAPTLRPPQRTAPNRPDAPRAARPYRSGPA